MTSFAWLDSSPEDRRRVLDALEQFKDSDSRDELGLAAIRDGFANHFFPGTGTLQTRAGYFLFVPWLYLDLHRRKVNHDTVATVGRRDEIKLVNALLASDDDDGVIGKVARDKLKRLPQRLLERPQDLAHLAPRHDGGRVPPALRVVSRSGRWRP